MNQNICEECCVLSQVRNKKFFLGNPSYYPYGNGDFTARRLDVAANMYPDKNVIFDYYRELELCSEKEQQAQDQLGDDEPSK